MKDLVKWLKIAREQQDATKQEKEGYNVFYALKIWQKETTLHSRLIADLLHPRGYHGLGIKPMELFMECLKSSLNLNVSFECNDKVKVIDEKATDETRRIDIFLKDENGQVIIIENKIYAADQSKQLWDYYEFGEKVCGKDKKPVVLYLTLAGTMPCKDSARELNPDSDYYCISYQDFIKKWINQCLSVAKGNNALTEVLKQYLQVIEYLTQENMDDVWGTGNFKDEKYDVIKDIFDNEYPNCVRQVGEEIVEILNLFNNRNEKD